MSDNLFNALKSKAADFLQSPVNDLGMSEPEPVFGLPLWGVAAGNDILWAEYKGEPLGPFHWLPVEAFALGFPGEKVEAEELSILVWVIPYTRAIKQDNRKQERYPSERWARARIFGEAFVNVGLAKFLLQELDALGVQAVAPSLMPEWSRAQSDLYGLASTWSERHAAYAAGLGTFGLSDGLITSAGKAMRVGSLIIRRKMPVTPRPYSNYREYCLFFKDGSCGVCVKRCPVESVSFKGRNKDLCFNHLMDHCAAYVEGHYGFKGYGCGLCQTGVPCQNGIPGRPAKAGAEVR